MRNIFKKIILKTAERVLQVNSSTHPFGYLLKHKKMGRHGAYLRLNDYLYSDFLGRLLKKLNVDVVIDVGANNGQFANALRREARYTGRIISFEPVKGIYENLTKMSEADPLWDVYNYALGNEETTEQINVASLDVFSSFLKPNDYSLGAFPGYSEVQHSEEVTIRRLDNIWEELSIKDNAQVFLKIDTQGYDLKVFEGLGEARKHISVLQSEVSMIPIYDGMPDFMDSLQVYRENGFEVSGLFPVAFDKRKIKAIEFDCLMTSKEIS